MSPHHPRMLCEKFGGNRPIGSGEDFKTSSMYFCHFVLKDVTLHLNKLESPSQKDALY